MKNNFYVDAQLPTGGCGKSSGTGKIVCQGGIKSLLLMMTALQRCVRVVSQLCGRLSGNDMMQARAAARRVARGIFFK